MLWSLAKVVLFLALIALVGLGAGLLSDTGGQVRLQAFGWEFTLAPLQALIAFVLLIAAVWLLLRLLGLLGAVLRFLNGDETAISRYFDRNRERRGYQHLTEGMIALAAGEHNVALARARSAERLLKQPELTTLLTAQAAEAAGDGRAATEAWKALLAQEQTRFVAVRGLLRQKLVEGDTATALKLAEKAFALKPRHAETQDVLLKLQAGGGDWSGARSTLSEKHRSGALPKSVWKRRDALLALQEAKAVLDEGNSEEARLAAIEANRLSPDLIPAAVIAARAMIDKGDKRGATKILKKAWEARPHPDLAAAFAAIEPDETPVARLKRFKPLLQAHLQSEETRLTHAELSLAAEEFRTARVVLGDLTETHPTQRTLAILAAAERGMGAPDDQVRAILTRALAAPRGPQWCCDACQAVQEAWGPVCADCGGFDTLSWRDPPATRAPAGAAPALAPLLFDRPPPEGPAPAPEAEVLDPQPEPDPTTPDDILRRAN